ncbi:MAG: SPOR domain-containing protein [Gammaproteobacteria bacterium]|nr:SPOR domain-containing protein [Gammaproteobacteria bacterium]
MKEYRQQEGQRPNLQHRLVGALVLIALAVIVVPLVLDFDAEQLHLSARDNIPEQPRDFHIEEVPLATSGDAVPPGDAEPAASASSTEPPAAGRPAAWVVQAGSFSSEENARALRDQLRAKGYKAVFIDREVVDGKPVLRVRIGPEMERARSEQVREKVARDMKLNAVVVSYDGRGTRTE